jgi:hypothetical protein
MSMVSQASCDKCKKRTDDVSKSKGWIELGSGGRGGFNDFQVIVYGGHRQDQKSRQEWHPLHFRGTKCLVAYIESIE